MKIASVLIISLFAAWSAGMYIHEYLILPVFILGLIILTRAGKNEPTKPAQTQWKHLPEIAETETPSSSNIYAWPGRMEYDFEVVGESYYQTAIDKIAKQQEAKYTNNPDTKIEPLTAYLIPDDYNQYDDKAVRVDIDGLQVGHLNR